jgi:hypothetical protein
MLGEDCGFPVVLDNRGRREELPFDDLIGQPLPVVGGFLEGELPFKLGLSPLLLVEQAYAVA